MKMIFRALAGALLLACASCGGTVVESVTAEKLTAASENGPVMGYFLPIGQTTLSLAVEGTRVATTLGEKKIVPDYDAGGPLYLRYDHQGLSTEDVTLSVDANGLLKQVATTTQGQALDIIKAVNEILTQYSAFKVAEQTPASSTGTHEKEFQPPPPQYDQACKGLKLSIATVISVASYERSGTVSNKSQPSCTLTAKVSITRLASMGSVQSFPKNTAPLKSSLKDFCKGLVCFRSQSLYRITVEPLLTAGGVKLPKSLGPQPVTFRILAPDSGYLGYIRFPRGTFASKTVDAQFTDGILTQFNAKNSSELVGFLAIPAAALTTATLIEKLN